MKVKTLEVAGIGPAIHAMRNPFDSWAKSDTVHGHIGPKDRKLSETLANAGTEHSKHLRFCVVWAEIWSPLYWWKQMDCYRNGVEKLSCSTMHTLMNRPFEMSDFCFDAMPGYKNEPRQFKPEVDTEHEIWAEYKGYKVSNQGRVFNSKGNEIFGVLHRDGYRFMWMDGRIIPMHRIIAECFCSEHTDDMVVDHKDCNKQNNRADNLEWVTPQENTRRARENNLIPKAITTYTGKLTEQERDEIKELCRTGEYSRREIGRMYGVSHSTICSIANGRYKYGEGKINAYELFAKPTVNELNRLREEWLNTDDKDEKQEIWQAIIAMLPESYIQRRTVMMSYQALRAMYKQREGHKLAEWQEFRDWCRTLPESWMITGEGQHDAE